MDAEIMGPPFGDGPWEEGEKTVRSVLNRVVVASVQEDPDAEFAAWTEVIDPQPNCATIVRPMPAWQWVLAWVRRRAAVALARAQGYVHSGQEVVAYVQSLVAKEGAYQERATMDGTKVVYEFASGKWLAFDRCDPLQLPCESGDPNSQPFVLEQPYAWRQLAVRPSELPAATEEEKRAASYKTPFDDKLEIECDKHKGSTLAECGCKTDVERAAAEGDLDAAETFKQGDEVFGRPIKLARDIDRSICARCDEKIAEGCGVETPAKTWVHLGCWEAIQKEADGYIGRSKGAASKEIAKATGTKANGGTLKDAPAPEWEADYEEGDVDWGEDDVPDPFEDDGPGQPELADSDAALLSGCTDCGRSLRIMPLHWPPQGGLKCPERDCKGRLFAWSALTGRPVKTADLLEGRPTSGKWECALCDEPAHRHMTYREGGPLSCGDCPGFVRPVPAKGSLCLACHHVHSWTLTKGVINICDECGTGETLVNYEGLHQLEQLKAQERKARREEAPQPNDPDRPTCEACQEEPAAIRFTRPGKNHPVMLACRTCADKDEVRGRRRAFSEVA